MAEKPSAGEARNKLTEAPSTSTKTVPPRAATVRRSVAKSTANTPLWATRSNESVAVTATVVGNPPDDVPEMTPLVDRARPAGSRPSITAHR